MKNPGSPAFAAILVYFLAAYFQNVQCDCYLHNPRGNNDRLNGAQANRQNGNRLFDSQNNAKGGYVVGEVHYNQRRNQDLQYNMKYFMSGSKPKTSAGKSILELEWTNQHGCGDQDLNCDIILQYQCQSNSYGPMRKLSLNTIRNGESTRTPTYRNTQPKKTLAQKNKYKAQQVRHDHGYNEPWEWYDKCNKRQRNKGLFTADQKLNGDASKYTRQNPNGNQHGYECPEERDYYPYWHPTDWKDIAVMANSESRCKYYKANSFNRKKKGECLQCYKNGRTNLGFQHFSKFNNPKECRRNRGTWVEFTSFLEERPQYTSRARCAAASTKDVPLVWGIPYVSDELESLELYRGRCKPKASCLVAVPELECKKADYSRANHLGNVGNVVAMGHKWTIPYFPSNNEKRCVLRIRYNISTMDYDRDSTFSAKNGNNSPVKNDPVVEATDFKIPLQLAVNTAQFGRTFQDRSYVFILKPRKMGNIADDVTLYNLNVRGKRGNIVQVYPAVEYDFVPKRMTMRARDLVHIQWTGSNLNPNNNAGEGRGGTDRTNIVQMEAPGLNTKFKDVATLIKNAEIIWAADKYTLTNNDTAVSLATSGFYRSVVRGEPFPEKNFENRPFQNQLDNSSPSFPGMVLRVKSGKYYLMCTRNNNFTNRNQKAQLTVI